jgi:hypothetical protein
LDAGSDATSDATADAGGGAPDAGAEAGATDAAGWPDGSGGCTPDAQGDSQCAGAAMPPHMVRCVMPYQPPASCQVFSIGNVTDLYCCP